MDVVMARWRPPDLSLKYVYQCAHRERTVGGDVEMSRPMDARRSALGSGRLLPVAFVVFPIVTFLRGLHRAYAVAVDWL